MQHECQHFSVPVAVSALGLLLSMQIQRFRMRCVSHVQVQGILKQREGPAWKHFITGQLTPQRAMQAMAEGSNSREWRKVHFCVGPWVGMNVTIPKIQSLVRNQRWEIIAPVHGACLRDAIALIEQVKLIWRISCIS